MLIRYSTTVGFLRLLWVALLLSASGPAVAEGVAVSAAQALFDEGRRLMLDQRYPEACDKFGRSQRLEPAGGTLLNLALCHEQQGKLASAYLEYTDALALSLRNSDDARAELARKCLKELVPRVAKVVVQLDTADNDGTVWLKFDGNTLEKGAIGVPVPVDLGTHALEVGADGKVAVRVPVQIAVEGSTTEVLVPPLESAGDASVIAEPSPVAPSDALRAEPSSGEQSHTPEQARRNAAPHAKFTSPARWTLIGASFGTAATATLLAIHQGFNAFVAWDERESRCPGGICSPEAKEAQTRAERSARLSDYLFVVGAIGAGVGLYLVWDPFQSDGASPELSLMVNGSPVGVAEVP